MNSIYVLDRDFNFLGVIDEYVSVIWRPAYFDIGDFEIYMGATDKAIALLKENNFVVRSSDITVDKEGNTTYKKVMIIKSLQLATDIENGDFLTATGRELKYLLHQRIVWKQTSLTGTAENAIRRLVTENAIAPTDSNRIIPNLILGDEAGLTSTIEKQVTGDYLDQTIVDICSSFNFGWDIHVLNNQFIFSVYEGIDRSYGQTERPYVVFSDEFENLHNTEYELKTEEYANTTLIGGEGEGSQRFFATVGNENSGFDRYELFTDANDISRTVMNDDGTETILSSSVYTAMLQERGNEKLAELTYTEGFSGEVLSDITFKYGEDFNLGDTVTVINKYKISRNAKVLSAIESEDESGKKLVPQFNI